MADGTPLEALETGDVQNTADAQRMQEIMRDINQPAAGQSPMGSMPAMQQSPGPMRPMPQQPQQPPMYNPNVQPQYVPVEEEEPVRPLKKNIWSSILERVRDPLFVCLLVFLISIPAFHTQIVKLVPWAYAVGGQLSWLGLGTLSVLAGLLFAVYRGVVEYVG